MVSLSADYFILAFCLCAGVIQIASAYSRLYGLLILPDPRAGYLIGFALSTGALTWFVLNGDVGIPGDIGGVEGSEQFALFFGAAGAATLVTPILCSLTQLRRRVDPSPRLGMEALREATLLQLLRAWLRRR